MLSGCTWIAVIKWAIHPALPFRGSLTGVWGGYILGRLLLYGDPGSAALALIDLEICTSEGVFFFFLILHHFLQLPFVVAAAMLWDYEEDEWPLFCSSGESDHFKTLWTTSSRTKLTRQQNFFHLFSYCLTLWVEKNTICFLLWSDIINKYSFSDYCEDFLCLITGILYTYHLWRAEFVSLTHDVMCNNVRINYYYTII